MSGEALKPDWTMMLTQTVLARFGTTFIWVKTRSVWEPAH